MALPKITLVVGLPGSGKSTFLRELQKRHAGLRTYDDFIQTWYTGRAKEAVDSGVLPVVLADPRLCNPETLERFVRDLRLIDPTVVFLDVDPMTCLDRIRQRSEFQPPRSIEVSLWSLVKQLPSTIPEHWLTPSQYLALC